MDGSRIRNKTISFSFENGVVWTGSEGIEGFASHLFYYINAFIAVDLRQYIRDFFNYRRINYSLRGDGFNLILPKFNLQRNKGPFRTWLVNIWNKLPLKVRQAANINDFKQNLMNVQLQYL